MSATAFVRISRCLEVRKSFRKLSVNGRPLACIDFRILSNVHLPTSTGIPSNATRRAEREGREQSDPRNDQYTYILLEQATHKTICCLLYLPPIRGRTLPLDSSNPMNPQTKTASTGVIGRHSRERSSDRCFLL